MSTSADVLGAIDRAYRCQEIVWFKSAGAIPNNGGTASRDTVLALPLTCTGMKLGVLLLEGVAVDPGSSHFDHDLTALAADIVAAKLLSLRTREIELAKAANEARLKEVQANRAANHVLQAHWRQQYPICD